MTKPEDRWERIRAKGKWSFIVKYGVLRWGVGTAVGFSIVFPLLMGREGGASFLTVLPIALVLFPLGGLAWGAVMWGVAEANRRKREGSGPASANG